MSKFRAGYEAGKRDAIDRCLMERVTKTEPGWRDHNVALGLAVIAIRALDFHHAMPVPGANDTNKPRVPFTVAELAVDAIAIKAAHGHPDYPVTAAEVDILLTEICRLRKIEATKAPDHE